MASGEGRFLETAVQKAMTWMYYQSPSDRIIVAQLPTSDWRDEQWVLGFGLFVNTLVYSYLRLYGEHEKADLLHSLLSKYTITADVKHRHVHEGLAMREKPYYALWSYKNYGSERFDLLGNSLAILTGIASSSRANAIISWVERECAAMRKRGKLVGDLPPNFFPLFVRRILTGDHATETTICQESIITVVCGLSYAVSTWRRSWPQVGNGSQERSLRR
jgi:hypothetical protein